jgi:hypothetical protein
MFDHYLHMKMAKAWLATCVVSTCIVHFSCLWQIISGINVQNLIAQLFIVFC